MTGSGEPMKLDSRVARRRYELYVQAMREIQLDDDYFMSYGEWLDWYARLDAWYRLKYGEAEE